MGNDLQHALVMEQLLTNSYCTVQNNRQRPQEVIANFPTNSCGYLFT